MLMFKRHAPRMEQCLQLRLHTVLVAMQHGRLLLGDHVSMCVMGFF